MTPLSAAHRGISSLAQENTETGIILSIEKKVDIIDLDIMSTNDGNIVLCHDENVKDMVVGHKDTFIKTLKRAEIAKLVIAKETGTGKYNTTNHFSFLDEVFDKYLDRIIFWLDIKDSNYRPWQSQCQIATLLADFLGSRKDKLKRVIVSSTNPFVIIAFRKLVQQQNFLDKLTFGFDYGINDTCCISCIVWSKIFENCYGSNYVTMSKSLLTQNKINDYKNRDIKVMPYAYPKGTSPPFENIYGYLMDY